MQQATVELIGARLGPFEGVSSRIAPEWPDIISLYPDDSSFGEVRSPDDWHCVPVERWVRVVYLVDDRGPVIRWASDEAAGGTLGGCFHDRLERGDGVGHARSGWLRRSRDGTIQAHP